MKWTKTPVEKSIYCGQLILGKINKFDATRCQILRQKCTKSISAGAPPQTPLGELTVVFNGPTSKGRKGIELSLIHI